MEKFEVNLKDWNIDENTLLKSINKYIVGITPLPMYQDVEEEEIENDETEMEEPSNKSKMLIMLQIGSFDEQKSICFFLGSIYEALYFAQSYIPLCNSLAEIHKCFREYYIGYEASHYRGLQS